MKKKTKKIKEIKLNVDLKQYLDKSLAKDNLNLIKQLEQANNTIIDLEEELEQQKANISSKEAKEFNNVLKTLRKAYDSLINIDDKQVEKDLKKLVKIKDLKYKELDNLMYSLVDYQDGSLKTLLKFLPSLRNLYVKIENCLANLGYE